MEEAAQVFVHEILHSYTTYAYDTDATFRKEINKYHKIALSHNSGFSKDVYEFMANTLEPGHMATLLEIPSENNSSNLLKDIIKSLVKHIRAFFKIYETRGKRTLFHDVIETIYNHKKSNSESINNVSKVVDENGEPLVVYHNSKKDFNTFKPNSNNYIYFTSNAEYAKNLKGGKQYEVFINSKNPLDITGDANILWEEMNTIITEDDYRRFRHSAYNDHFTDLSLQHTSMKILRNSGLLNDKDGIIGYDASGLNEEGEWLSSEGTEYVVFNPNQIKSATSNNGEFSTTNNDIRYSSVTEQPNRQQSVQAFTERLPIEEQAQFMRSVARGDVSTACR